MIKELTKKMEEHQIYKGIKVHKVDNEFEENLELLERNGFSFLNSVLDTEYVNEIKLQLDKKSGKVNLLNMVKNC